MGNTTVSNIKSIIEYLKETGADERAMARLLIEDGDADDSGIAIESAGVDERGFYDPLMDCKMVIPRSWDGVLFKSNNGWDWLGIDKGELTAEDIRGMVRCDRTLDDETVECEVREICQRAGIKEE